MQGYPSIYGEGDEGGSDLSAMGGFSKRWGWYHLFYALANGDVTRFEEVSKLNLSFAFTHATYEKEKSDIERQQLEKAYRKQ